MAMTSGDQRNVVKWAMVIGVIGLALICNAIVKINRPDGNDDDDGLMSVRFSTTAPSSK